MIGSFGVAIDLMRGLVTCDSTDFELGCTGLGEAGSSGFAQAMCRTMIGQTCLVTPFAEPVSEPVRCEGLTEFGLKISLPRRWGRLENTFELGMQGKHEMDRFAAMIFLLCEFQKLTHPVSLSEHHNVGATLAGIEKQR